MALWLKVPLHSRVGNNYPVVYSKAAALQGEVCWYTVGISCISNGEIGFMSFSFLVLSSSTRCVRTNNVNTKARAVLFK